MAGNLDATSLCFVVKANVAVADSALKDITAVRTVVFVIRAIAGKMVCTSSRARSSVG